MPAFAHTFHGGPRLGYPNDKLMEREQPVYIQWTLTRKLEHLDFGEDLCLLSHKLQNMQIWWHIRVYCKRRTYDQLWEDSRNLNPV